MNIDIKYIGNLLKNAAKTNDKEINKALDIAESMQGLTHHQAAMLLFVKKKEHLSRLFNIARNIKKKIYDNRIVMFAPLYISDYCVNRCSYCSYNANHNFARKKLTMDEIRSEVAILEEMGHKRIALEAGEDPKNCSIDYVLECMQTIYAMKTGNGEVRRINVNIAGTTVENYKRLKSAGIGTYILFQETYHQPTYEKVHIAGPKRDFEYHLNSFDRCMEGGIDDVGGGVLFGLADPCFEVISLILHNEHLENKFGVGFHTISVPRICRAQGMELKEFEHAVDDETFRKIVAVIRLTVPFTGMILSTRETGEMRKILLETGISQLSAGSSTSVGGYASHEQHDQFQVRDERAAYSVIEELMDDGYIPSFCTACYRSGRTGDRFMKLAKQGKIKDVCLPNALMTLKEYSMDYGNVKFKAKADRLIEENLHKITSEKIKFLTKNNILQIEMGKRDLFV